MGMTRWIALALLALGAACKPESAEVVVPSPTTQAIEATALPCGLVLSPDPGLLTETETAAARWTVATGCPVTVGEGGTRIRLVDVIVDAAGAPVLDSRGIPRPGFTHYGERGELIVEVTAARTVGLTLPHEIGHVLNPREGHVPDETSLMCHDGGLGLITAADLEYVCEGLDCEAFVPEA